MNVSHENAISAEKYQEELNLWQISRLNLNREISKTKFIALAFFFIFEESKQLSRHRRYWRYNMRRVVRFRFELEWRFTTDYSIANDSRSLRFYTVDCILHDTRVWNRRQIFKKIFTNLSKKNHREEKRLFHLSTSQRRSYINHATVQRWRIYIWQSLNDVLQSLLDSTISDSCQRENLCKHENRQVHSQIHLQRRRSDHITNQREWRDRKTCQRLLHQFVISRMKIAQIFKSSRIIVDTSFVRSFVWTTIDVFRFWIVFERIATSHEVVTVWTHDFFRIQSTSCEEMRISVSKLINSLRMKDSKETMTNSQKKKLRLIVFIIFLSRRMKNSFCDCYW